MIIKIVCAGEKSFSKLYHRDLDEVLIGVDAGVKTILELGLEVDLAMGDFDSISNQDLILKAKKKIIYPSEKDLGDLELAISYAITCSPKQIEIYDADGGRLDHFLAAINMLWKYIKVDIVLKNENNLIQVLKKSSFVEKGDFKYLSFFSNDDFTIISLNGVKYPLSNYCLQKEDNLCLSNEIINEVAEVIVDRPVLMIHSR